MQEAADAGTEAPASPPLAVAACPWCGPGSQLTVRGDGFGGLALCCMRCGASGPTVPLDDFATSDTAAVAAWSRRSRSAPPAELLARVRTAIGLHQLTGSLTPDAAVGVPLADLHALMRAAGHA